MPNSSTVANAVHDGLVRVANHIQNKLTDRLNSGNYPHGDSERGLVPIQNTITIGQVQRNSNSISIDISLGGSTAPYAVAYEYGSGIHRTRGSKSPGTYPITPKNKQVLAFDWPGHTADFPTGRKYVGATDDGRLMFMYVDHPGVDPKPYVQPTLDAERAEVRRILGKAFRESVLIGTERVTEIIVR